LDSYLCIFYDLIFINDDLFFIFYYNMFSKLFKFSGGIAFLKNFYSDEDKTDCCGIIGFIGK